MGFPFKKKKVPAVATNDTSSAADSYVATAEKKRWSPMRKKTPATVKSTPAPSLLGSLNVMATDDIEVITLESQRALMDQREAIRKKLFETNSETEEKNVDTIIQRSSTDPVRNTHRTATEVSKEILPDGKVKDTVLDVLDSKSDQFSMPLSAVSGGGSWDGSLRKIAEEPVEYKRSQTSPISVDVSYTESELESESVLTLAKPPPTPARRSENQLDPPSQQKKNKIGSNTPSPKAGATAVAVVSPASSRSSKSIPMDERETDTDLALFRARGKSPLKGMPDDERNEYQKDEMLLSSPVKEIGPGLTEALPPAVNNDDSYLMPEKVTSVETSTDVDRALFGMNETEEQTESPSIPTEQHSFSLGTSVDTSNASHSFADTSRSSRTQSVRRIPEVARSIAKAAFQCGSGALENTLGKLETTEACGDVVVAARACNNTQGDEEESAPMEAAQHNNKRPVYLDEPSAIRFLRRITNNGFVLLNLQATDPSDDPADDWKGRTVTMLIIKGQAVTGKSETSNNDNNTQPPRLEWITVTGGQALDATTTSVNLLDIQSILTNDEDMDDEEDSMCFFTITTEVGDVHMFEAATLEERDRIVNGLKTLLARWSFHLIAGDTTATSELYDSHRYAVGSPGPDEDDMPSLPNPKQTMNRVAHSLLD